jgi:hypothetical protein
METEHKQIMIKYGDMEAEVDEGIAPLILEMWKADIMTFMSCENNGDEYNNLGDVVWVLIDEFDVSPFLNFILGNRERDGLYYRANMQTESEDDWMYDVLIDDLSLVIRNDEVDYDGPPEMGFRVSIRFPVSDYPEVLRRMSEFNAGAGPRESPGTTVEEA